MAKIDGNQPQTPIASPESSGVEATGQTQSTSGVDQTDSVSRTSSDGTEVVQADSLDKPKFDAEDAIAMLQQVLAALNTEQTNKEVEAARSAGLEKKQVREEITEALKKAADAMEEAKKKGELGKIFGWIGCAVAIVAAVAATIATFGAAAPASGLAIAGCIAAMTGAALATTTQAVMSDPKLMESMSEDDKKTFMYTMMALQIACAIISLGAGAGSALNAGKATADATTKAVDVASKAATTQKVADLGAKATTTQKVAGMTGKVAQVTGGANEVAEGAVNISAAASRKEADLSRAEVTDFKRVLVQLGWEEESAREFIESLIEFQDAGMQVVAGVKQEAEESRQKISQNV